MQQIKIDKRPLHAQARQHLLNLIEEGAYQPGQRLPSEADLAAQLGISRPTLREALFNLEREGVIVRKHGVGTFVTSEERLESGLERLESILTLAARQGMTTEVRGLSVEKVPANEQSAERLARNPGTALTCVRRTIVVERGPAAYLVDHVPVDILPPSAVGDAFDGSILDLLRRRNNVRAREVIADITAVNADASLAHSLEVEPGQALLLLTETLFDEEQAPIEFSRNYFRPNLFSFHVLRR